MLTKAPLFPVKNVILLQITVTLFYFNVDFFYLLKFM